MSGDRRLVFRLFWVATAVSVVMFLLWFVLFNVVVFNLQILNGVIGHVDSMYYLAKGLIGGYLLFMMVLPYLVVYGYLLGYRSLVKVGKDSVRLVETKA